MLGCDVPRVIMLPSACSARVPLSVLEMVTTASTMVTSPTTIIEMVASETSLRTTKV